MEVVPSTRRGTVLRRPVRSTRRLSALPVLAAIAALVLAACSDLGPTSPPENAPPAGATAPPGLAAQAEDPVAPGRILAAFTPGANRAAIAAIAEAHGARIQREIGLGIWLLDVTTGAEVAVANALSRAPDVRFAEPDRIRTFPAFSCETCVATGDPFTGYKWDLVNTGEVRSSTDELLATTGEVGADINWLPLFEALQDAERDDVTVAILDSGIRATHEDLAERVVGGWNFFHDTSNHADDHGHGTHVAGIAAAHANNGVGLAGVAHFPEVDLLSVKVCGPTATWFGLVLSYGCTDSAITEGIIWAADQGAHVLNLSLGGADHSQAQQDALAYALDEDALPVCAAGNNGTSTVSYPARNPECVAVSSTNWSDGLASYSNWGDEIELSAPGGGFEDDPYSQISSALHDADDAYGWKAGTSMASPQVAGLAAVLYSLGVGGPDAVRKRMHETAHDLGDPGWDPVFGYGRIDAAAAIEGLVDSPVDPPPPDENEPPVASFAFTCTELSCDFDASESYDPDGTIESYDWAFGDGNTGSGEVVSHTYGSADTYTVTLTVTDNDGATDTTTENVAVEEAPEEGELSVEYEVNTRTTGPWNRADVTWSVSHTGGELGSVTTELLDEEEDVLDSQTSSVSGASGSGEHNLRTRNGTSDKVRFIVTDADGTEIFQEDKHTSF